MVECDLAKVEVAGSTPVSRSIKFSPIAPRNHGEGLCCKGPNQIGFKIKARYPSGKGEVCKTFMRRFDPDPRLQLSSPMLMRFPEPRQCHCACLCFQGNLLLSATSLFDLKRKLRHNDESIALQEIRNP